MNTISISDEVYELLTLMKNNHPEEDLTYDDVLKFMIHVVAVDADEGRI